MKKLILAGLLALTGCAHVADVDEIAVFIEPPTMAHTVIGTLEESTFIGTDSGLSVTTAILIQQLQAKASYMGANGIIIGDAEQYIEVVEQVINSNIDPFKTSRQAWPAIKMQAKAIKWQ